MHLVKSGLAVLEVDIVQPVSADGLDFGFALLVNTVQKLLCFGNRVARVPNKDFVRHGGRWDNGQCPMSGRGWEEQNSHAACEVGQNSSISRYRIAGWRGSRVRDAKLQTQTRCAGGAVESESLMI